MPWPRRGGTRSSAGTGGCCARRTPDHGGAATGAADRIADLAEARRLLLALATERRVGG
ncbi:MAG: hypothetical protein M5U14_14670 [Acidimicrobiia bacterium]|nr:hypothetical protein [Acidimicrobiia bacterium]